MEIKPLINKNRFSGSKAMTEEKEKLKRKDHF
jgi:hypothetical protein